MTVVILFDDKGVVLGVFGDWPKANAALEKLHVGTWTQISDLSDKPGLPYKCMAVQVPKNNLGVRKVFTYHMMEFAVM